MKRPIERRLNTTYQKVKRNRHVIAKEMEFTDQEFRLFDLCLALYDWDKKHTETYMTVEATDYDISNILHWSPSKVCRTRNSLIKKGVLSKIGDGWYRVLVSDIAEVQSANSGMQFNDARVQQNNASMQQDSGKSSGNTIVSYKDKNKVSGGGSSEERYQNSDWDFDRERFSLLDESDIRWIHENIKG